MSEVHRVIPLDYATPRPRRRWRVWKIPGDAVLDFVAALLTGIVNLAFLDEAGKPGMISLEAWASLTWALLLLYCGGVLIANSPRADLMHRVYGWGKLVLALVAIVSALMWANADLGWRIILCAVAGASFAFLLIYVGVMESDDVRLRPPID